MSSEQRSIIRHVDWVGDVTTVVGALGGAGIGVRGALAISRSDRRAATRDRTGEAFSAYLAGVVLAVGELRQWPNPGEPTVVQQLTTRAQDKLYGEGTSDFAARRGVRATFGDRPWMLADAVVQSWAVLRVLPLDDETRAACDAAVNYVERLSMSRAEEIKAEWPSLHARLMDAASRLGAEPVSRRRSRSSATVGGD